MKELSTLVTVAIVEYALVAMVVLLAIVRLVRERFFGVDEA